MELKGQYRQALELYSSQRGRDSAVDLRRLNLEAELLMIRRMVQPEVLKKLQEEFAVLSAGNRVDALDLIRLKAKIDAAGR